MTDEAMNTIELARVGDGVIITLRREVGQMTMTRRIATAKALAMSILLTSKAKKAAVNYEVEAGLNLQIENAPFECAWLSMDGRSGERRLVVGLEGDTIPHVGRFLHQLSLVGESLPSDLIEARTFRVGNCYLEE